MANVNTILEFRNISISFAGVTALDSVNLGITKGEVHVLVGENGAGKSSLCKILCGVYTHNKGEIFLYGRPFKPREPLDSIRAGIRIVYQEFNVLPYLSIAENIYYGKFPSRRGLVDYPTLYRTTEKALKEVGLELSPRTLVEQLGVAQKELVQIAKAISLESNILILDEPTASLTQNEIQRLFEIIRRLREKGVTIIYISHRLQETLEIGDRVTVMRNGKVIGTRNIRDITIPEMVRMMVGRDIGTEYPFDRNLKPIEEILRVEGLRYRGGKSTLSLSLKSGELLGIAGLVGSGRTETIRAIFGADKRVQGKVFLRGKEVKIDSPRDAVEQGIALLTEDRKAQGLLLEMPCYANITITDLAEISQTGLMNEKQEHTVARDLIGQLAIQTPNDRQEARFLSGGNQQKLVLSKWIFKQADILFFDEPTRGIDVGAKYEIYLLLCRLAAQGKGMIIISSDLPELIGMCHRILVFSNGKISGEVAREQFSQEAILSLAYKGYLQRI